MSRVGVQSLLTLGVLQESTDLARDLNLSHPTYTELFINTWNSIAKVSDTLSPGLGTYYPADICLI